MSRLVKSTIGAASIVGAFAFGIVMDNIAEVNKPHRFTTEFQRGTTPVADYQGVIEDVVDLMQANANYALMVETHTGTRGPDASNMVLSEQRGARVVDDLERAGVDMSRITVVPLGETQPPIQGDHETDAMWQRRSSRAVFILNVE